jgi:hypothetical protein
LRVFTGRAKYPAWDHRVWRPAQRGSQTHPIEKGIEMSIVTILIIIVLVLVILYFARRVF